MNANVAAMIETLIGREGKYSNDKNDNGGETMWGITIAVARAYGYAGPMRELPRATAILIYTRRYWLEPQFDKVEAIATGIGEKLFDFGVNCGQSTAAAAMQRCLNVLNQQGSVFPDMAADGRIGTLTLAGLKAFLNQRREEGRKTLLFMIAAQQSNYYVGLAEKRSSQENFEYGWQRQRALLGVKS
jgi:lysozyme family protein